MFYVYEWFIKETNEVIYVGKGTRDRYKVRKHNLMFNEFLKRFNCESRIVKYYDTEEEAFNAENERVCKLKSLGQCVCNINTGGRGGLSEHWTPEKRRKCSEYNVMKSQKNRDRMKRYNPMFDPKIAMKAGITHKKPVIVDGKLFDSVTNAAEYIGTWDVYLTRCIRSKSGICKGHKCEYANQKPSYMNTNNSNVEGSTTNE